MDSSKKLHIWRLTLTILVGLSVDSTPVARAMAAPPNIVFILADDLGWADLPCYGNEFHETPHLDQFAREGMRFTEFYAAAPICSPTRASIFSGQYPARIGLSDFVPGHWRPYEKLAVPEISQALPLETVTPAEALKVVGFRTGYFGKWHLGREGFHPSHQGFDEAVVTSGRHFAPHFKTSPERNVPNETLIADWLTDQTIDFIRRSNDRPFFVTLAHYAVHIPLESHTKTIAKYRKKTPPNYGVNNPTYAAMVEDLDRNLGRLMKCLKDEGLDGRTLVVFTSDNGGLYKTFTRRGEAATSNTPLRGEKGTLYEGGVRVPLLIRWQPRISPNSICREPALSVDFLPTFLELVAREKNWKGQPLDGKSLIPLFAKPTDSLDRESLYFHYPHYHHSEPAGSIRSGDWKLIEFFADQRTELYNLRWDIGETRDWSREIGRAHV